EAYHTLYHEVYGLKATSLRLTNTYGPRMRIKDARQTFVGVWLRAVLEGKPFEVWGGAQKRDFTYVDDAVEAFLLAALAPETKGKVFNLGGEAPVSLSELAALLVAANGGGRYLNHEFPAERRRIDIGDYFADDRLFRSVTGWEPRVTLVLAVKALGLEPEDYVATVSHTAVATVAAIELAGAKPLLIDIDPASGRLDPAEFARALANPPGRIAAVIPVHLYGLAADLSAILDLARAHDVRVIEDCAQSHGALFGGKRLGSFGDLAAFSFYPTKNLGAFGDGGAVVTSDPALAARLIELREYGWRERYVSHLA